MEQFQMPQQTGGVPNSITASWNTNVLKEPRGMIRIIQLIFAILAFTTTINFDTNTSFTISCFNSSNSDVHWQRSSKYIVEYPFDFSDTPLLYLKTCASDQEMTNRKFPIDFSSSAKFFVFIGVLAFLYTAAIEFVYISQWQKYENNQFFPLADLACTGILAIFWFAGAFAWAFSVSDIKYYAGPHHLIGQLSHCNQTIGEFTYNCFPESPGKWSALYISLIFGFANFFLWGSSMWFVYKETIFHRRTLHAQPVYPNISGQTTTSGTSGYGQSNSTAGSWEQQQAAQGYAQQDMVMNNVAHNPTYVGFTPARQ